MHIIGLILAGGLGRRMAGADKALLILAGRPLLCHVTARLAPQVAAVALNANGDPARFVPFGLPVLPDPIAGFPGPLAGVLAGLDRAAATGADAIVTVAVDTPFFPADLVVRLVAAGGVAMAASGGALHPTFALWPVALKDPLREALMRGQRRVREFAEAHGMVRVDFPGGVPDPFFNINHPADLAGAETLSGAAP